MSTITLPPRSEIKKEHTWNAESVFPTRAEYDAAVKAFPAEIERITAYRGRLGESPEVLAEFVDVMNDVRSKFGKIYAYGNMSSAVDSTNADANMMAGKSMALGGQLGGATAFIEPELLEVGESTIMSWIESTPALASVKSFAHDLFRRQAHVRSAEVEELLGQLGGVFPQTFQTYRQLTDADLQFADAVDSDGNKHTVSQGTRYTLRAMPDRTLRKNNYESFTDAHLAVKNTLASNLLSSVKSDVFRARARKHDTALEAALFEDNLPVEVFYNLIDTFKKNIPTWHKYWNVRRRMLGYDELHPYDIWAPLTDAKPNVPYEEAVDWICEGLKPLGDDYVSTLRRGCLQDRWVDIYPNVGKRQGAFSDGAHATFPFILMSYDNGMGGMSTLAHELGHSMHSYLSRKNQTAMNSGYTMFAAETASNFNQAMTRAYLREAKKDDVGFQIALIEEAMGNFHRYFFIMPTLARFELEVHTRVENGQGMTADDMNELMADLFAEGYGDEMTIDRNRVGITWGTFLHMYMNYYVFNYATGLSAAHALADKVLSEGESAAKNYLEFLSSGSTMYPLDALKHAGVDMTKPDAVETTFGVLSDMVNRLEELAGL